MPTSRIRKLLSTLFVFVSLCVSAQAETYYWIGGTPDNNWSTPANWSPNGIPGANDIVYIHSDATIDIGSSDIRVDGISLGNNNLSYNFNVEIKGSGTLTVTGSHVFTDHNANDNGIVTFRPTNAVDDTSKVSNLKLNCNVISPSLAIHSGGNVTIAEGKIARITNVTNMAGSANTPTPTTITVDGFLAAETITLANFDNQKLSISSTGYVSAKTVNKNNGTIDGTVYTQTDFTENVWLGRIDTAWTNPFNWSLGKVPEASETITIAESSNAPVITTAVATANLTIGTNITVNGSGSLTLTTGTFDISKINNNSTGTLIFSGNYSHSYDDYSAPNLAIECGGDLTVSKKLECKSISVAETTTLDSRSGQAYLVATDSAGISFGGDVTVYDSGNQFVLGGNVSSTGAVNINIESGMLNHVEERTSHNKTWGTYLTTVLSADNCSFGMAEGSSYKVSVTAPADSNVYFVGSGTFKSLEKTNPNCIIHFGNSGDYTNTFTFNSNVSSLGKIVFDSSCSGLTSTDSTNPITLSGITDLDNQSTKLTSTLGVNLGFEDGTAISGKSLKVKDITFDGTANFATDTDLEVAGALSATGKITFGGNFTTLTSASAIFSNGLSVAGDFSDSGTSFSGTITLNNSTGNQSFSGKSETSTYAVAINKTIGNVTFTNPLTLTSLTTNTDYAGEIIFSGEGNQSFTAQSDQYKKITVNKDSGARLTVSSDLQTETFKQTTGNVQFNGDVHTDSYTHTAGSIEFKGNASFTNSASFNNSSSNTVTFTGGTSEAPHTILGSTLTLTNLSGDYVTVDASSIQINGANVLGLGIASTPSTVKMQGTITTTGSEDFVIDYPLLLTDETTINASGNIVIKSSSSGKIGSIKSSDGSGKNLNLTASEIQILNGAASGAGLGDSSDGKLGEITINSNLSLYENTPFYCNKTIFAGSGARTLSGAYKLTHAGDIEIPTGKNWTFNNLFDITGNLENKGTTDFKDIVSVDGSLSNIGSASFDKTVSITGYFTNSDSASATFKDDVSVTGNVTDNGTWNSADGKKLIFNGTGDQFFTPKASTTYKLIEVNKDSGNFTAQTNNLNSTNFILTKCNKATFRRQNSFGTFTITECSATTFNGISTFATFNSTATSGNITFANDATIKYATTFNTSGTVSFSNSKTFAFYDGAAKHSVTHTAGPTNITGTLTAATVSLGTTNISGSISASSANFGATTITGDTTITTEAGDTINFYGQVTGTASLSTVTGSVNFADTVSGLSNLSTAATATFNGNVNIGNLSAQNAKINCDSITTTGAQSYAGTVSLLKNGDITLTAKNGTTNETVTFAGGVDCSGATGTQNLIIDANANISCNSISTTGSQNYKGKVTINNTTAAVSLEGTSVNFEDTITGATNNKGLTLTATATTFGNEASDTVTTLTSLSVTGSTIINTNKITTTGNQTYTGTTQFNTAATVTSGGGQNYTGTITLNENLTLATGTSSSITFGKDITGTGKTLTLNTPQLISSIAAGTTPANINLDTLSLSRNTQISSTNAAEINLNVASITGSGKTLSFDGNTTLFTLKEGITVEPALENNKTINCVGAATFKGNVTNTNGSLSGDTTGTATLTFEKDYSGAGTSALTASKGQTIFNGNVDLSSTNFIHSYGSVILKTAPGGGTTSATLKTGTGKTFNDLLFERQVKLEGTGTNTITSLTIKDSVEILCSNTIGTFTADSPTGGAAGSGLGGKTITFGAGTEQTVEGTLTLKGSDNSDDNRVHLCSSTPGTQWKIKCTGQNNHNIQYVDVKDSLNKSETGSPTATSYNLFALDSIDKGHNTKWNFPGMKYVWEGSADTNWNNAANWKYTSIPGKGADIEIPAGCSKYPVLLVPLDLNETYNSTSYKGKITVASNAQFDLAGKNLTLGEISNYGLVRLIGAADQTISGKMINQTSSTVEYYDTGAATTNFVWDGDNGVGTPDKQYVNLILNQNTSGSDILEISKDLTINNPASLSGAITVGGNLIIAEATSLSGVVKVTGTTTISAGTGKTVTLNNAANIFTGTVKTGDSNPSALVNAGAVTLKASSPITLANNANADSLEVLSAVKLQNVTTNGNQSYAGSVETITGPATLKSTAGDINFGNPVTLGVQTSVITSAANRTITFVNSATINGTQSLSLSSTRGTTFGANVGSLNSLSSLTVTGPLTVNCESIKTRGAQQYNSPVEISSGTTETITSTEDGIHFADTVTINDNTTISVEQNHQIIFDKAVTGDTASSLTTNATTVFNTDAIVSDFTTITTNKANINSASITSSGAQTFNGAVSIGADTALTSTNGDITLGASLDGAHTITFSVPDNTTNTITISGQVGETNTPSVIIAQAGNVSFSDSVKSDVFTITKANNTHFTDTLTTNTIEITQANNTKFDSSVTASVFTINQAANTTFDGEATIVSFTDTANAGNISFNAGGRIQNDVIFNTNDTVSYIGTINIGAADTRKNLTHIAGNTTINGTLNAADVTLSNTNFTGTMNAANVELSATSSSGTITAATTQIGNLTLTGDTSITTNGTQSYNGTIDDQTSGLHTLELNSDTSQITFAANVGSTPIKLLNVTGPLAINCQSITTTEAQNYNSPVAISSGTTETITSKSDSIHFADVLTINADTNISVSTNKQIVFDKAVTSDTTSSLTTNATSIFNTAAIVSRLTRLTTNKAEIHCPSITSLGTQTYNGAVTFGADTALTSTSGNITLASTLDGAHTITFSVPDNTTNTITISGKIGETNIPSVIIAQAGNVSFAQTVKSENFTITKANDTHFAETLATNTFEITQANSTQFDSSVTTSNFKINQAASTTFDGQVTIASFTDTANAGNISFNEGGRISNTAETIFSTNGLVTFGDNSSDDIMTFGSSSSLANIKHTTGNTSITGILNAADVAFADTSFEGIMNAANITLGQTDGGQMTINNSGLFTTTDSSALTYTTSFSQIGSGNAILGGSFTGSGNASFAKNLQIYGSSQADFGAAGTNINIAGNLIILRNSTDELNLLSNLTVTENFVLYKSPVTASADISAENDILIFGEHYSTTDTSTGITDEYSYTTPRHSDWSQPNYTEANLPDDTDVPTADFTATLAVSADNTISVGKNFYANGTTLSLNVTSGQWNLKLPDLTNPVNGFAEAYHSVVSGCKVICNDGNENGTKSRLAALECTDSGDGTPTPNTNVEFEDFQITKAYTVRDNVIRVEFNQPIRYHPSTINFLKFHNASDAVASTTNFTGFYSDPDCQLELKSDITQSYTDEESGNEYWYFYIKAEPQDSASTGAWNTDATGKNSGAANGKSSDRDGIHHTSLPCLDFPRSLVNADGSTLSFIITDRWGKRLNNYSRRVPKGTNAEPAYGSQNSSNEVADKTGPVLWTVRTGQELHDTYQAGSGETSQHSYDSHNFLEFRYSEPVDFYEDDSLRTITENFQVTDSLGAIQENISQSHSSLTFAGLAKLNAPAGRPLKLYTGSQGNASKYVNALYRLDEYSIRLSIAGFTDGTVSDYAGNVYKKWPGYIEEASQFTGANALACTTTGKNNSVKDLTGNCQEEYASGSRTEPEVLSSSEGSYTSGLLPVSPDLYSKWDLSSPVITPLRFSKTTEWGNQEMAEAIGNTNGSGSTLDRIDFHFFDNTPTYSPTDTAEWYTEIGWCNPNSEAAKENLKDSSYTYCADIIGGARQFAETSCRTSGGIRFSTKVNISPAFKYSTNPNNTSPDSSFKNDLANLHTTIVSQLFTGSSEPMRPANDPDGLYLGLGITDNSLSVETTFAFSYNETQGYLTDLAGNRLRTFTSRTIDRTPPSFDVVLSPIDTKSVYIIFVKELETKTTNLTLRKNDGTEEPINESFETLLPKCFRLISIDDGGNALPNSATEIQIDTSVPAQIIKNNSNSSFTCIKLTTTEEISIDNIKNLYIQLIMPEEYPSTSIDPYTSNQNSRVTLIRDTNRNYMTMYSAHALSDFAINYVNPLYAYSSDILDSEDPVMNGLYENGSWAVHDWNANQNNYGTLPAEHPVSIVADTKNNQNIRIYLSPAPDSESVSKQFNKDFNVNLRVWLPELTDSIFRALTSNNNTNYVYTDGREIEDSPENLIFDLENETVSAWKPGNQISFMFGLMENENSPVRIHNNPYYDVESGKFNLNLSIPVPLFCLRMPDTSNINSLDLWSFKLKNIKSQRGGVTILNNVIDAGKGEKTVVKVDMPEDGRLNVAVMTLDGNIITYLHRGNAKADENYFTWDGKNRSGSLVARGMYFIRVFGGDFDETRKVMVIK